MNYLCTITTVTERHEDASRKPSIHERLQHIECRDKYEADRLAVAINRADINEVSAQVSGKVYKRDGGAIILPLEHWFSILDQVTRD